MDKKLNSKDFINAISELQDMHGITPEVILSALEQSLLLAYRHWYDPRHKDNYKDIKARVDINKLTGEIHLYSQRTVVAEVIDDALEVEYDEIQESHPTLAIGDIYEEEVDVDEFTRVSARQFRQNFLQKIKEAQKEVIIEQFKMLVHELIPAKVEKVEKTVTELKIGEDFSVSAVLPDRYKIPGETFQVGEVIDVYVSEVDRKNLVTVSRVDNGFVKRLFEREIAEIKSGDVVIRSLAREPGKRVKVAVQATRPNVDATGACIGPKAQRVQRIQQQIAPEKIEVIQFYEDAGQYIIEAIKPAHALSYRIDEDNHSAIIVVPNQEFSIAIGKEGQNARLAAKLTGWKIDIKTVDQALEEHLVTTKVEENVRPGYLKPAPVVIETPVVEATPVVEVAPVVQPVVAPQPVVVEEPIVEEAPAPIIPAKRISVIEEIKENIAPVVATPWVPKDKVEEKVEEKPIEKPAEKKPAKAKVEKVEKPEAPKVVLPIYSEDELKELEAVEEEDVVDETDIDFDDYDEFYEDK